MKRLFGLLAVLLLAGCGQAAGPTGSAPGSAPAAPIKIKVAYGQPTMLNAPTWIALDKGLFKKYGLDVELSQITGSTITTALLSRTVEFIGSTGSSTFLANMEGGDTLLIGSTLNVITNDIVANPKKIQKPDDVRGKNAAISKGGDFGETAILIALNSWGINRNDVKYVTGFTTPAARLAAMANGAADFTSIDIGERKGAEDMGLIRLMSLLDAKTHFIMGGLFTSKAYANSQPAAVEAYLKAMTEALYVLHKDKAATLQIAARYMKLEPNEVEPAYSLIEPHQNKVPELALQDVKDTLLGLDTASPKAATANPDDFYTLSYLDKLKKSGFYKQIWGAEAPA